MSTSFVHDDTKANNDAKTTSGTKATIKFKRLAQGVQLPTYAYVGDGGMDLRAAEDCCLKPFERAKISCGLAVAIPDGYAGLVLPRSGLAIKEGLSLVNAPGLIDSQYRGELAVIAINLDPTVKIKISCGQRIAQLVIIKLPQLEVVEVNELDVTERATRGFGSSGKS